MTLVQFASTRWYRRCQPLRAPVRMERILGGIFSWNRPKSYRTFFNAQRPKRTVMFCSIRNARICSMVAVRRDTSCARSRWKACPRKIVPVRIMQAAYLMSNWDGPIAAAGKNGKLPTILPKDLVLPMVSPRDLGSVAADLLKADPRPHPVHVEGPERYCPQDMADVLTEATGDTSAAGSSLDPHGWSRS